MQIPESPLARLEDLQKNCVVVHKEDFLKERTYFLYDLCVCVCVCMRLAVCVSVSVSV